MVDVQLEGSSALPKGDSLGIYNMTASLATRFLQFPSRLLARVRQLDDILDQAASPGGIYASAGSSSTDFKLVYSQNKQRMHDLSGANGVPGLWGFLTSGYFVGLLLMVYLTSPSFVRLYG